MNTHPYNLIKVNPPTTMTPLNQETLDYFAVKPAIDSDGDKIVPDEEFEERIAVDTALRALELPEPVKAEGRLQLDIGNVGIGEWEIPGGPKADEKRFKKLSADLLSKGILLVLKRYINDSRHKEKGLLAMGRLDPKTKEFADFDEPKPVEFTNRVSEFREGVTYLFSRNGKPEITVHGGDDADRLNEEYIENLFESAADLKEVE